METTFISIHDLSDQAITLYTSDSVVDVLGYTPDELVNTSAWDHFHPDELPLAQHIHGQKIRADKAAVLAYCRIQNKSGEWVGCECCFSIVYDVMIACTSVYQRGLSSEKRALEAPLVRRCFSSSPEDPRYHMLSHISTKLTKLATPTQHEPRAALFLNRFTRTLTIMYATAGLKEIVGIPAEEMRGRSFYYCIAPNCLQDAVKCLENAKANNSMAYLRFWFRDPRIDDNPPQYEESDSEDEMTATDLSDGSTEVADGEELDDQNDSESVPADSTKQTDPQRRSNVDVDSNKKSRSRNSSGESTREADTHEAIFGQALYEESSASSLGGSSDADRRSPTFTRRDPIELEAVVSCASDGLVVCLRRARPLMPLPTQRPSRPRYSNGLFAAPWAMEPVVLPQPSKRHKSSSNNPDFVSNPDIKPAPVPVHGEASQLGGPSRDEFMAAIREQAIFAWALTGINGSLYKHKVGVPTGEALPEAGIPIWDSDPARTVEYDVDSNQKYTSFPNSAPNLTATTTATATIAATQLSTHGRSGHGYGPQIFGDPGLDAKNLKRKAREAH